jgi:NAD(P)-dependent dehydrogenase (short-subunit alcohol dehydrogenase family)
MQNSNKTVLITGASSGLGKAAAKLFADKGWNVIATMRSPEKEEELSQLANVLVTRLDVQDFDSIGRAVSAGIAHFGKIDALVNNAGYGLMGIFEASNREQIQKQFDVNVFGLMDVTRALLPHFRANKSGVIINISSFGGQVALPTGSFYNATKFAVEGFSESLAYECTAIGVQVKIVEPGSIATNFGASLEFIANPYPEYDELRARFMSRYASTTAHLTKATTDDVAETIYQATTDGQQKLRYVIGPDAQFYIDRKFKNNDEEFVKQMRDSFIN